MLPDRVSNPGPLTYESGALPIALRGPVCGSWNRSSLVWIQVCLGSGKMINLVLIQVCLGSGKRSNFVWIQVWVVRKGVT